MISTLSKQCTKKNMCFLFVHHSHYASTDISVEIVLKYSLTEKNIKKTLKNFQIINRKQSAKRLFVFDMTTYKQKKNGKENNETTHEVIVTILLHYQGGQPKEFSLKNQRIHRKAPNKPNIIFLLKYFWVTKKIIFFFAGGFV